MRPEGKNVVGQMLHPNLLLSHAGAVSFKQDRARDLGFDLSPWHKGNKLWEMK
jgi:hypothetical protein